MAEYQRLGIDFGTTRLRVVLATLGGEAPRIENFAYRDLPDGAVTGGVVADVAATAEALREAVDELQTRERRCVFALNDSVAKMWTGPFPTRGTIQARRSAADVQARQAFPDLYDRDAAGVRIGLVSHPARNGEATITTVVREALGSRLAVAKAAGLRVLAVDIESLALARATGASVVIDVGHETLRVHGFISPDEAPLVRSLPAGGTTMSEELALEFSVSMLEAERIKRDRGAVATAKGMRTLDTISRFLEREIPALRDRGVRLNAGVDTIALVGNGCRVEQLPEVIGLAAATSAEAVTLEDVESSLAAAALARSAPDIALAYGCALWGTAPVVNLNQSEQETALASLAARFPDQNVRSAAAALAASIVVFFATGFIEGYRANSAEAVARESAAQLKKAQAQAADVEAYIDNVNRVAGLLVALEERRRSSHEVTSELSAIENALPPHMTVRSLTDTGKGWDVSGRTRNATYVSTAVEDLNAIPGLTAHFGDLSEVERRVNEPSPAPGAILMGQPLAGPTAPPYVSYEIHVTKGPS